MLDRSSNGKSYTTSNDYVSLADWDPMITHPHDRPTHGHTAEER
jgi:hypothetical protein